MRPRRWTTPVVTAGRYPSGSLPVRRGVSDRRQPQNSFGYPDRTSTVRPGSRGGNLRVASATALRLLWTGLLIADDLRDALADQLAEQHRHVELPRDRLDDGEAAGGRLRRGDVAVADRGQRGETEVGELEAKAALVTDLRQDLVAGT